MLSLTHWSGLSLTPLIAALSAVPAAFAQPVASTDTATIVSSIKAKLRSGDPRLVAWGAHDAERYAFPQTINALSAAMIVTPDANDWVLDALVQLHASLPASQLLGTYDRWPIQTLALLADSHIDREAVLVELFKRATGDRWFAIANLLLERQPPELTMILLRELRLALHVAIVKSGHGFISAYGGGSCGGATAGSGVRDQGYPPPVHYRFSGPQRGAVLLMAGPHPVYYIRSIDSGRDPAGASPAPTPRDRLAYLAALAGFDDRDLPVRADTYASVEWAGQAAFEREVAVHLSGVESSYAQLLQRLLERGRLTAADAERLSPAIDVDVTDGRR